MPSIDHFFKLTTGSFSWPWDNDYQSKMVGVMVWPHQVLENTYHQEAFESGHDHQGCYVVLRGVRVVVQPDPHRGYNFICPNCRSPVRAVYLKKLAGPPACRHCFRVTYNRLPSPKTLQQMLDEEFTE